MLTVTGKFLGHSAANQVTEKLVVRRFWVDITDKPEYPNTPEFQLINDKVNLTEPLKPGDNVEVSFSLSGRKWEKDGKKGVNTNLNAYAIQRVVKQSVIPPTTPATAGNDDDLPF